jgi:YfiH family protein
MVNADFLQSALFRGAGFRHAFFTRQGGVSAGPFESLNFSVSVGDDPLKVDANLRRAAVTLGVPRSSLYFASQVHGTHVEELSGGEVVDAVIQRQADALLSSHPGVACAVRTADCVPVLFADPRSGTVAASHAGWRGLVRGVLLETLKALVRRGCRSDELLVAIGPHISVNAFEVSPEVAAEIQAAAPGRSVVSYEFGSRPHCDLRGVARAQLLTQGVAESHVDDVWGCTLGDSSKFFSYRRDGKTSGRHLSAIVAGAC